MQQLSYSLQNTYPGWTCPNYGKVSNEPEILCLQTISLERKTRAGKLLFAMKQSYSKAADGRTSP